MAWRFYHFRCHILLTTTIVANTEDIRHVTPYLNMRWTLLYWHLANLVANEMFFFLLVLSDFFCFFPACLCATDFPTVWIFREPFIPARPWPSQQDLEHLTTPHDCHHLCVAFTAGDCPINGRSCWYASGNQRIMRINFFPFFFFPGHSGNV